MNLILFSFVLLAMCSDTAFGMTREQLKKTLTMTKKQCMPKTGVTEAALVAAAAVETEKVGRIEQGVFYEEKNVMCYVTCIYKSIQVVKNEKLNKDMVIKQIDILYPPDMKAAVKKSVANCISVQENYNTECERVFYSVKCLYEDNPSNFVFP